MAGHLQAGPAWSTIKVPLIMARYRLAVERREGNLSSVDERAQRAITASDNAAAAELFAELEAATGGLDSASRYVGRELEASGDVVTHINTIDSGNGFSTYGQTQWSLDAGTDFYRQLVRYCVPPRNATRHVLDLMARVTRWQRWGLGAVAWPGATAVRFKGGWGPDPSGRYLVRQFGIVEIGDRRGIAVGLMARDRDGGFQPAIEILDAVAAAVSRATTPGASGRYSLCARQG